MAQHFHSTASPGAYAFRHGASFAFGAGVGFALTRSWVGGPVGVVVTLILLPIVIDWELTDAAKAQLASEGWDPSYGARPLKRTIQQRIENPLASRILAGEFGAGDSVRVDYAGGAFVFKKSGAATQ